MSYTSKTFSLKKADVEKQWIMIDATDLVVGRLASFVAFRLRGKHKVNFTPHVDCGDHVVIVNADKVKFTGNKLEEKLYYRHSGYPGGIKEVSARRVIEGKFPERVLHKAVERMLPRGPLFTNIMKNLKVYAGNEHPHQAQNPVLISFSQLNKKNVGR